LFTEGDEARSVPVLEIAERHGAKLKPSGKQHEGPCPLCGGHDRFWVVPSLNTAGCRGCDFRGDAIALERHLSGGTFVEAVRALIGGTRSRRQPTPEEVAAREAREAERRRVDSEANARNEASAARIIASLQPVVGTPGEVYLRNVRKIDVSHWAIKRVLEDAKTLGWSAKTYFRQENPSEPFYELNGQWLGAIIGILTDPITGEPTGGITRTYLHQGRKICRAMSLGGVDRLGIIRLSPDDEVLTGLHLCEGIESALSAMVMGFLPMWAAGSSTQMKKFPVLNGVEYFTAIADNDVEDAAGREVGQQAAREVCQRWANAGREAVMKTPKRRGEDANDVVRRRARA
jgi:hypothetical protein